MDFSPADDASYADQLDHYTDELARGGVDRLLPALTMGSTGDDVARYVENAVGERIRMLRDDTRLVALAIDGIESLIYRYVELVPRPDVRWGHREASDFLSWLATNWLATGPLDARAADFVAFQTAEFACLELAHRRQSALRAFHAALRDTVPHAPAARLTLNPARVWTQLSGRSLGRDDFELTPVLFAPRGEGVCQHAFRADHYECLMRLEIVADTTTFSQWQRDCALTTSAAIALVRDWHEKEIVAAM